MLMLIGLEAETEVNKQTQTNPQSSKRMRVASMNILTFFFLHFVSVQSTSLRAPLIRPKFPETQNRDFGRPLQNKGSAELKNINNQRYLCTVSIGNPAQNFSLMLDTGSSITWIVGKECTDSTCDNAENYQRHKFDSEKSTSFVNASKDMSIRYLSSEVKGYAAEDEMSIEGITFRSQGIVVATKLADGLGQEHNDGLLGLSWQFENGTTPFFQNILSQLSLPIFTIWLNNQADDSNGGMMTLGDYDDMNCDSNVTFYPLSSKHRWNIGIESVHIGSFESFTPMVSIIDTGAPRIGFPEQFFYEMVRQMNATVQDGLVFLSCDDTDNLPDIEFLIGGLNYKVTSHQYIRRYMNYCLANIFNLKSRKTWLFGDPWMRSYCHVFDMGRERIGLSETRNHMLSKL